MAHGRGAGPENILNLLPRLSRPSLTYLAPAAANRTWYPYHFMTDIAANEPGLSSALGVLGSLITRIEKAGVPQSRIVLLGFSQGACLSSEFAIRHAGRFGGVIAFSGGAIGPAGTRWEYPGTLHGTPAFFGCSDQDAHVPESRVTETAAIFARLGADVTTRIYPGMGHVVSDDEIAFAQEMLDAVSGSGGDDSGSRFPRA